MISRRKFVKQSLLATGTSLLIPSLQGCEPAASFSGGFAGQNASLGHMLRTMKFDPPVSTEKTDFVIVGGGVSGLAAARILKQFTNNFTMLEMGDDAGGNAAAGINAVSAYPWGAHYLPLPNNNYAELTAFLEEVNVITGYAEGLPVFNEYYLCFDPKERLYIHHYWQEGLIPREGVPQSDRDEMERFLAMMDNFRNKIGSDGRPAFTIPVDQSSQDKELTTLDSISMETFMQTHGFKSPYLRWYVSYCCADDFGSSPADTSAWAGIHYFASRKTKAANATSDTVLTWPEGNFWLVNQLRKTTGEHIRTQCLVYRIDQLADGVSVYHYDATAKTTHRIDAKRVIMATPQFISQRLLTGQHRPFDVTKFEYAPWMVANMIVNSPLNEKHGEGLSWDNVIYGSDALGYVHAAHQHVGGHADKKAITYYKPLLGSDTRAVRQATHAQSFDAWKKIVADDLKKPHKNLETELEHMDVWIWGHGMVRPSPGMIWGEHRKLAALPMNNVIFFAHSDLSGISIFEEAFRQGTEAAKQLLASV